jgi:predicted metal-binding membrane protein
VSRRIDAALHGAVVRSDWRVGCCWAIMHLMFVVGTGSVGWMLILGALMALEKRIEGARTSPSRRAPRACRQGDRVSKLCEQTLLHLLRAALANRE